MAEPPEHEQQAEVAAAGKGDDQKHQQQHQPDVSDVSNETRANEKGGEQREEQKDDESQEAPQEGDDGAQHKPVLAVTAIPNPDQHPDQHPDQQEQTHLPHSPIHTTTTTTTSVPHAPHMDIYPPPHDMQPVQMQMQMQSPPFPPPPGPHYPAFAMAQFYEARMRDHAAAYASAAAGAAWAAAQIACSTAPLVSPALPQVAPFIMNHGPHQQHHQQQQQQQQQYPPPHYAPPILSGSGGGGGGPPYSLPPRQHIYPNPSPPQQMDIQNVHAPSAAETGSASEERHSHRPEKRHQNHPPTEQEPFYPPTRCMSPLSEESGATPNKPFLPPVANGTNSNHRPHFNFKTSDGLPPPFYPSGSISYPGPSLALNGLSPDQHGSQHNECDERNANNDRESGNNNNNNNSKRGRRRLRSTLDNTSSGGESNYMGSSNSNNSHNKETCTHNSNYKKHARKTPKIAVKGDNSLVGKTGVSALHEWCAKRRMQPPDFFMVAYKEGHYFEFSCRIQGQEWGLGRAGTKVSAKQDAARRALQAMVPGGVVFDINGILIEIPHVKSSLAAKTKAAVMETSLEDLAPNLASRLAIGVGNGDEGDDDDSNKHNNATSKANITMNQSEIKRHWTPQQQQQQNEKDACTQSKRRLNIYPGTSTTSASEDDDDNEYYACRGASVCSSLLHAMWQIDDRISEPPTYEFSVVTNPTTQMNMQKGSHTIDDAGSDSGSVKGSFSCRAALSVRIPTLSKATLLTSDSSHGESEEREDASTDTITNIAIPAKLDNNYVDGSENVEGRDVHNDAVELSDELCEIQTFQVVGTGASKREARHVASAKLLAMLFPDCSGMVEVKVAAEAAREEYAAGKVLKQHLMQKFKRIETFTNYGRRRRRRNYTDLPKKCNMAFALPAPTDPPLPTVLSERLLSIFGNSARPGELSPPKRCIDGLVRIAALSLSENTDPVDREKVETPPTLIDQSTEDIRLQESVARQLSRRRQLEEEVDSALQIQSEVDDGGRCLKTELSEHDVGRIVLRRAGAEDLIWVRKLLACNGEQIGRKEGFYGSNGSFPEISPVSLLEDSSPSSGNAARATDVYQNQVSLLWGSTSVVLLLSRAVALHDEPPLGCAILTLGFSMRRGRILRVSEIAHEKHLPQERFVESLDTFSNNMKCGLEIKMKRAARDNKEGQRKNEIRLNSDELKTIVYAHVNEKMLRSGANTEETTIKPSSPLQSVKEEEWEGEEDKHRDSDSDTDRRVMKGRDKPSKRSRVS